MSVREMNSGVATTRIPDIGTQARETIKRQAQEWFEICDRVLDIHRCNFVFREPSPAQLTEHKTALKVIIRTCLLINAWVLDPKFNEPDLADRLQIRIQQLEDAYNTFHDAGLSDEKAEQILNEVFPG